MPHKKAAIITAAHGLKGYVKLKCFLESYLSLKDYSPITIENQLYYLADIQPKGKGIIAKFQEVNSREQAEALIGSDLLIDTAKLPKLNDDEYYCTDLINISVVLTDKSRYGTIINIYNFGAGEVVEIAIDQSKDTILLPFNSECFPSIDMDKLEATLILPNIT